jgi:dTDP-4-amino-4,6-dideoxygalactose transaminase
VTIPLVDLSWQHQQIAAEVRAGWDAVLAQTAFIHGDKVTEFEDDFARYVRAPHCVGVANGTDALEIALRSVGIKAGDLVALPANTFIATAFAVARIGAVPRLVDVDDSALLMDPDKLEADIGDCRAVIAVHLFGQVAPMEQIEALAGGRTLVEDAAQAQGATRSGEPIGSWGAAAATSFYPGKNLGAYGDAGAIVTHDEALARTMRLMANHGSSQRYVHETFGFNSRLDTLQAVVLGAKLRHLDEWNRLRREAAGRYDELLAGQERVRTLGTLPGNEHVWHVYPVRVADRDRVLAELNAAGLGAGVHYATPIHLQPAFADLGYKPGDFPVTEEAAATQLSLPMFPGITADQQERVVTALVQALD